MKIYRARFFILDAKVKRRVIVHAPHDLTNKELARVRKWMDVQFERDEEPDRQLTV